VCLDRFEDYLLRKAVSDALYLRGEIPEKTPFCMSQDKLCRTALEVKKKWTST
jgi:hypothetical protein